MSIKCVGGFNGGIQKWNGECYFSLVGLDKWSEKASSPFDQSKGLRAYIKVWDLGQGLRIEKLELGECWLHQVKFTSKKYWRILYSVQRGA